MGRALGPTLRLMPRQRWQREHDDGQEIGPQGLSRSSVQSSFTDAEAAKVNQGWQRQDEGYGAKLSEADIKALVAYVRSLKK
jgi:hypothetical protein